MKQKRSYYRRLEALRNEFEIPSRAFLIALGIHLEMNVMEIDRMLDLAGMAPLYSKDTVEGRLRFYLEMYQIENPELFADGAMDLRLGSYKEQDITLVKCIYKKMKRDQRQCKDEQIWKDIIELL